MNRIREGCARVRSPFGGGLFDISLRTQDVIAVVFWTKNAAPILQHLDDLVGMGHSFTFLYTINNYPELLEPRVPRWDHTIDVVRELTSRFSPASFRWRYDTIVLTSSLDRKWHLKNFELLCGELSYYTRECIFSFCDYYKKTKRNMQRFVPDHEIPDQGQCVEMAGQMADIAAKWDIALASCSHDYLVGGQVGKASCIDPEFLAAVVDSRERLHALRQLKTTPTRKECGCAASRDIGAYDTCAHGCVYCYANANPVMAARNLDLTSSDSMCLDPRCSGTPNR